ncbi:hypothetical protein Csa_004181 [Cucumis sativus]|uniref:Uncharacterized protein n=1 Tax=Cucumis sativus TaxID=3659 RepID=A0A0A0KJ44_CUCSA|nr:hypothetical protein Csa_004181 [Cucumis sativus]
MFVFNWLHLLEGVRVLCRVAVVTADEVMFEKRIGEGKAVPALLLPHSRGDYPFFTPVPSLTHLLATAAVVFYCYTFGTPVIPCPVQSSPVHEGNTVSSPSTGNVLTK